MNETITNSSKHELKHNKYQQNMYYKITKSTNPELNNKTQHKITKHKTKTNKIWTNKYQKATKHELRLTKTDKPWTKQ